MNKYILFLNFILLTACTQGLPEPQKVTVNQAAGENALTQSPTPVPVPTIPEANDENCKFEYIKSITDKYVQQSLADNCAKRSPKVKATKHKPWVF